MKEKDIQAQILQYLAYRGIFAIRLNNTPIFDVKRGIFRRMPKYTPRGVPDIFGILEPNGRTLLIEVKTDKGRLSPSQKDFLDEAKKCGALAFVARSIEDVEKNIKGVAV